MIVFDLACDQGHRFEGWFASSDQFSLQREGGLLACPECGSEEIAKAPMSPAIGKKSNQRPSRQVAERQAMANRPLAQEVVQALQKLAEAQASALKDSTWVGNDFAARSRAMHYGDVDAETIHGEATADEARELLEEGISVAPLPFPVAPPGKLN